MSSVTSSKGVRWLRSRQEAVGQDEDIPPAGKVLQLCGYVARWVAVTVAVMRMGVAPKPLDIKALIEIKLAEGEGFEPPEALPPQRFSRAWGLGSW